MDWIGHKLGHLHSRAHHGGDVAAPQGRIDSEHRGQAYQEFDEAALNSARAVEQAPEDDLDEANLLVQYEGVTRDGALQLSFDYDRNKRPQRKSPRDSRRKSHEHAAGEHATITEAAKVEDAEQEAARPEVPKLAVVMMVTGTRGDVQPFLVRPDRPLHIDSAFCSV